MVCQRPLHEDTGGGVAFPHDGEIVWGCGGGGVRAVATAQTGDLA